MLEMVLVIVLISVLAGLAAPLSASFAEAFLTQRDAVVLNDRARLALGRMTREIRNATAFTGAPFDADTLQFTTPDGSITYSIDGNGQLIRSPDNILATNVAALQFTSNAGAPPVTLVEIELTLTLATGGTRTFRTTVHPRNMP